MQEFAKPLKARTNSQAAAAARNRALARNCGFSAQAALLLDVLNRWGRWIKSCAIPCSSRWWILWQARWRDLRDVDPVVYLEEAMTMAGRIAIMNRGKFACRLANRKKIYEHRPAATAPSLSGSVNVFEGLLKRASGRRSGASAPGLMHPAEGRPQRLGGETTCRSGWRCVRKDHAVR